MGLETRLKAETKSRDSITDVNAPNSNKNDVQIRGMWEIPLKETYRLNAIICSSESLPKFFMFFLQKLCDINETRWK